MTTISAATRAQIAKRRSSRMALSSPVGLSGEDREKCSFTMPAKATDLNRHGAAIHVPRKLLVGSTLNVRNARGNKLSARVVSQLGAAQGVSVYGVEFVEPDVADGFWGINFPSLDNRDSAAEQADRAGIARRRRNIGRSQA